MSIWSPYLQPFGENHAPLLAGQSSAADGSTVPVAVDPTTGNLITNSLSGFSIPKYDYVTLTQASTTDTYVFKTGGSGGVTVGTITITYTDSGKGTISTVAKT